MKEGELPEQNHSPEDVMQDPEEEARALYGHILAARQKGFPHNFYLMQIVGARSSKSSRSILMLRYTVEQKDLTIRGTRVSKYLTPEELKNEIKSLGAVDLGKYVPLDEAALDEAAKKLPGHFKI